MALPPNSERGMFFLKDSTKNPKDVFLPCLNHMPFAKFMCKGLECTKPPSQCPFKHPCDVWNLETISSAMVLGGSIIIISRRPTFTACFVCLVGNVANVVSAKLSQNADMAICRRHVGTWCKPDMSATCGLSWPTQDDTVGDIRYDMSPTYVGVCPSPVRLTLYWFLWQWQILW